MIDAMYSANTITTMDCSVPSLRLHAVGGATRMMNERKIAAQVGSEMMDDNRDEEGRITNRSDNAEACERNVYIYVR